MNVTVTISQAGQPDVGGTEEVSGTNSPASAAKMAVTSALAKHPSITWTQIIVQIVR